MAYSSGNCPPLNKAYIEKEKQSPCGHCDSMGKVISGCGHNLPHFTKILKGLPKNYMTHDKILN